MIRPSDRRGGADIVLHVLEGTAEGAVGVTEHDLMELQDLIWCQRDILEVLMHRVQRVTITGDLFLVAGTRRRLLAHEQPQARIGRADPFDLIGGFGSLSGIFLLVELTALLQQFLESFITAQKIKLFLS